MTPFHTLARVASPLSGLHATVVWSELIGPEGEPSPGPDEQITLDARLARAHAARANVPVVLRVPATREALAELSRVPRLSVEAVIRGDEQRSAEAAIAALDEALDGGLAVRAILASGTTGFDAYRACAMIRGRLGERAPIRVRWDDVLDVKGAALALTFGADELAGPLAPEPLRLKLAQLGGPPEDVRRPSPAYVEALVRAAGHELHRRRSE
jgi:hypothetical protein